MRPRFIGGNLINGRQPPANAKGNAKNKDAFSNNPIFSDLFPLSYL